MSFRVTALTAAVSVWLNVCLAADGGLADLGLEELMQVKVRSAAMHPQKQSEAPASVTVITREDIVRYGYRTLAEALAYVPGFYVTADHSFNFPGLRGFNLPGDWGTRFLVLVDGHNLASNVDNSVSGFGQDLPVDLSLVEQIEVIRGPSSALYGTNGIFATINIVTRSPESVPAASVRMELGSYGEKKIQAMTSVPVGDGRLMFSGSLVDNSGEGEIRLPYGIAKDADGEQGYHLFSRLTAGNWTLTSVFGQRHKIQPVSWFDIVLSDRGTRLVDIRGFSEARYSRQTRAGAVTFRTWYDAVRHRGEVRLIGEEGTIDFHNKFVGDWFGTQVSTRTEFGRFGAVTLGVEARVEVRAGIHSYVDKPFSIDLCTVNKPDLAAAVFAQHEITLAKKWDLTLGVRGDFSKLYGNFASSRFGLVYRPFSSTAWKLIFGRSFRHPSAYEMFYSAPPMVANPNARAENSTSVEVVAEQRLAPGIELSVTAYRNMVPNLLAATYTANGSVQYQNLANQLAIGIETGVKAVVRGIEMRADVALQRAIQDDVRNVLANSPGQVAHFQASIPIARQALRISPGLRFLGERRTMANAIVSGSHVADVTLSSPRPFHGVEIQAGVRNLLDRQYRDPVALTPAVDTLLAKGRTFFVTLTWGTRGP